MKKELYAFPHKTVQNYPTQGHTPTVSGADEPGMMLRDYFAAQVAAGLATHVSYSVNYIAKYSYEVADLMLKERDKEKESPA